MIAKLRVGWTVAGWAPGVRTIVRSVAFQLTTWLTTLTVESCETCPASPSEVPDVLVPNIHILVHNSIRLIKCFAIKVIFHSSSFLNWENRRTLQTLRP